MSTRTEGPIASIPVTPPGSVPNRDEAGRPGRLARWAPVAAVAWSLGYLVLGIAWLAGAGGYPWHTGGSDGIDLSLMDRFSPRAGAWITTVVAAAALVLAVHALRLVRRRSTGAAARWTAVAGIVLGVFLATVVPDFRLLAGLGYAPMLIVGWIVGYARDVSPTEAYDWPWINLLLITLGGLSFLASGLRLLRTADRTERPGTARPGWQSPERAARWGRWAVGISVAVPLGYAVTRFAWALGIPLGLTAESWKDVREIAPVGAGLGAFAVVGAVLTLGLVRPWGETFPGWVPRLAGRRVPVMLAVVPATIVSVAVTSAGFMFVRLAVFSGFGAAFPVDMDDVAGWLPEMFWPVWGLALGAATYAYWLRRAGRPVTGS